MLRASLLIGTFLILVATSVAWFTPQSSGSGLLLHVRPSSVNISLRNVTTTPEDIINLNPSLSGDGHIIAFETTGDLTGAGGHGFRTIRADIYAGIPTLAQIGLSRAVAPALSQDGSRIVFASNEDLVGRNADRNSEIFLFDGLAVNQLTSTTPSDIGTRIRDGNFQPSITDDGNIIAFSSNRNVTGQNSDQNLEVIMYNLTTRLFTQITSSDEIAGATDAKISGDGSHVAYTREGAEVESNSRDLLLHNRINGTTIVAATNRAGLAMTYGRALSDDGFRLVYSAETGPNQSQVFLFDERSGSTIQITALSARTDDVPLHPTISGDGKRVA
jgi:Tol biopolymer transport system component